MEQTQPMTRPSWGTGWRGLCPELLSGARARYEYCIGSASCRSNLSLAYACNIYKVLYTNKLGSSRPRSTYIPTGELTSNRWPKASLILVSNVDGYITVQIITQNILNSLMTSDIYNSSVLSWPALLSAASEKSRPCVLLTADRCIGRHTKTVEFSSWQFSGQLLINIHWWACHDEYWWSNINMQLKTTWKSNSLQYITINIKYPKLIWKLNVSVNKGLNC